MLVDAILFIQNVQLICFTVIFGMVALQHWRDKTRRWLWYSFVVNSVGAGLGFLSDYLPLWVSRGINQEMFPLSYVCIHLAVVYFLGAYRKTLWLSAVLVAGTFPLYLLWTGHADQFRNDTLVDLAIALQVSVTAVILLRSAEQSTRMSRTTLSVFFFGFAAVEYARAFVAFVFGLDPDVFSPKLEMTSSVAYVVSTSVLPLGFIWMVNARLEAELTQQNLVDPLTHALNRRGLLQALDREMELFLRYGEDFALVMADLDHFKQLNDTYGHASGDAVLLGVSNFFRGFLRTTDMVGRIGGEEFVLLLPHTSEEQMLTLLTQLKSALHTRREEIHADIRVTASFGATNTRQRSGITAKELLNEADLALYRAKKDGRDLVHVFRAEDRPGNIPTA